MKSNAPIAAASETGTGDRFLGHAFSIFFALNALLYFVRFPFQTPWGLLLVVAVGWLLVRPGSVLALLWFSTVAIGLYIGDAPIVSNFLTLTTFLCLLLWLSAITLVIERRSLQLDLLTLLERFRPLMILSVSLIYLFSVLHKLNTAFLDPQTSEAVRIMRDMATYDYPWLLGWVPHMFPDMLWVDYGVIYGTLGVETLIPLLLLIPRFRIYGVGLDFVFHLFMGYRMYPASTNFPCLLIACLMLALSPRAGAELKGLLENWVPVVFKKIINSRRWVILAILVVLFLPLTFVIPEEAPWVHAVREFLRGGFWNLWVIFYAALFLRLAWQHRCQLSVLGNSTNVFALRPAWLWVIPVLFAFQCMGPHLGFKSRGCGELYSGLMTFGNRTNHVFLPTSLQVFPYLKDVVQVSGASSSGLLEHFARNHAVMPKLEFVRQSARRGNHTVQFTHAGVTYDLEKLNQWPPYKKSGYSWWEKKFLAMHWITGEEYEQAR